jgi:spermidine synthase
VRWFFGFFFVSGFCSILYELVWLRLAIAQFAVTTALVSIVLSAFMIGLGFGSWGAGWYVRKRAAARLASLRLYALVELLIGVSALVVSAELAQGRAFLERLDAAHPVSLTSYYILAGLWIGVTLVPWCACMGATFPFAMAAIRERFSAESERSFSYLYLANVLGALLGAVVPLLIIEERGFQGTLHVGAVLNFCLAASAFLLSLRSTEGNKTVAGVVAASERALPPTKTSRWLYYVLFGTGFTSMAVEIVWVRLFTPGLGTFVYAFATILGLYLGATYLGSYFYRRLKRSEREPGGLLFALLALSVVFPLLICDPRLPIIYHLRVLSLVPFSFLVGWITPMVLDSVAHGDPDRAGRGYAINIAGCVLGPLVSGLFLLPWLGERYTLLLCAIPWILVSLLPQTVAPLTSNTKALWKPALVSLLALALVPTTVDYETRYSPREVYRDSTATVTAFGLGMDKHLLVNGIGMTGLTPITKMMAHLPLASLQTPAKNVLVICFGMGTTHRSMLSWGVSSTAVELVPSVVRVFPYFHADAERLEQSPNSHIMVNDGRFFLERSSVQYDVIVLDPPPPVEAAASSLLYSKEFYAIAKRHLRPGGILQQWFPTSDDSVIIASVAKALKESFPYVRVFRSIEQNSRGCHFMASDSPLPPYSAATLASHLPPAAVADFLEWDPDSTAEQQFDKLLHKELSLDDLIAPAPNAPALQDDHPVNEYFVLRRLQDREYVSKIWTHLLVHIGWKG